ncbi:MAG: hypothetical protein A2Y38_04160 [Spirochaetes bacterium GWB1_59_5]|nr:MAG: hypothetical protein A2Y38_04160 [Spirochaetes bacterium GWB1_59_5]
MATTTNYRIPVEETFSWQRPVIAMDISAAPATPAKGDRYVVLATGSGLWTGHDGEIATCTVGGVSPTWIFDTPLEGWQLHNNDDDKMYKYSGAAWAADDISVKADKIVPSAGAGTLAELDGTGNLADTNVLTPTWDADLGCVVIGFVTP